MIGMRGRRLLLMLGVWFGLLSLLVRLRGLSRLLGRVVVLRLCVVRGRFEFF